MRYIFSFFTIVTLALIAGILYLYSQIRFDAYHIIDYHPNLTTQIFDRNGKLVANIFQEEHRLYAKYDEIPTRIVEALIAIEDTNFFEHQGINPEAIFRAIVKDIRAMKLVEGASTLTQQLIKNIALTREKSFLRKLKEAALAFKIESSLTKEEILERYLNHVYFGHGYYGIKTAAKGYFRKDLEDLSFKEIAILVGLPKAPSSYEPTKHLKLATSRANRVLARLNSLGWISEEEYIKSISEEPLVYDDTLTLNQAPYVVDEVIKIASNSFKDIKSGGYRIDLGIDLEVQDIARKALLFGYEKIKKRAKDENLTYLNGSIVVIESKTGNVLAMLGGVDYKKSNFNRATQSNRQPGSSIKPFIYQVALNSGMSPMSKIADISRVYANQPGGKTWKPKNYGGAFMGITSLKQALVKSRNLSTINLLDDIGLDAVHSKLTSLGFKDIPKDLTIALGSFGISPMEFSKFYSIFANDGNMTDPIIITKIRDRFYNEIKYEPKIVQAIPAEQSFLMVDILRTAVNAGTGRRARVDGIEIAGKTGTTNDNVDAWFCGFSPEIEVLVWYGNDNNTPMRKSETGGVTAAPVFSEFMKEYLKKFPDTKRKFTIPKGVYSATYNGEEAYFTDISPLPKKSMLSVEQDEGLLF